jgi:hypothetical protein
VPEAWSTLVRHRDAGLPAFAVASVLAVEVVARSDTVLPMLGLVPLLVVAVWVRRSQPFVTLLLVALCWVVADRLDPARAASSDRSRRGEKHGAHGLAP